MALDNEELKKRRQERAQQRKQREAQQRQLMLRLAIALIAVIACGVLIWLLSKGAGSAGKDETKPPEASTQPETTAPAETQPPTTVIHFAAAGDLNVTDKVVASGTGQMDYARAFRDVMPLFANADLSVLNFEGNLTGMPYGTMTLSAPQGMMEALAGAGVDMIQMANSKTISKGINGLTTTLTGIKTAGMEPLGAYATRKEFRQSGGYSIREINGVKVAVVAFTKGMDSMTLPSGSEDCVNLLYSDYSSTYKSVDTSGITSILRNVASDDPDITIALVHWGSEYNDQISKTQKTIRDVLLNNGVDAIIGTHPHYVQSIEYNQQTGTFVAYSLGDFFGDATTAGTEYSIMVDLEITKDNETGVTKITGYTHIPLFTVNEEGKALRVVSIEDAMRAYDMQFLDRVSKETYEAMEYALTRIEARINKKVE